MNTTIDITTGFRPAFGMSVASACTPIVQRMRELAVSAGQPAGATFRHAARVFGGSDAEPTPGTRSRRMPS